MPEWLKVLVGTIAGFLTATAATPINLWTTNWFRRRQLKRALYLECASNLSSLAHYAREPIAFATHEFPDGGVYARHFHRHAYEYALRQPDLFLQLREASDISGMYEIVAGISEVNPGEWDDSYLRRSLESAIWEIAYNEWDRVLLLRLLPVAAREQIGKEVAELRGPMEANKG